MFDYGTIDDLLKCTEHMEILRNNSLQDDGTDTVKGVDWFQYKGKTASTLYVSGIQNLHIDKRKRVKGQNCKVSQTIKVSCRNHKLQHPTTIKADIAISREDILFTKFEDVIIKDIFLLVMHLLFISGFYHIMYNRCKEAKRVLHGPHRHSG